MRLSRIYLAVVSSVLLGGLAACGTPTAVGTVSTTGAAPAPSPGPASGSVATADASASKLVQVPLGGKYTGPTISASISKPVAYVPSSSAMLTQDTGRAVAVQVRITNETATQSLPSMELSFEATAGDQQCQPIEDSAKNVRENSMANILPKHSLSWTMAFSVPKTAKDLTIQLSAMGPGKTLVFSGAV